MALFQANGYHGMNNEFSATLALLFCFKYIEEPLNVTKQAAS